MAPPIHIRFGIERVCQRDFGLAPLAEDGRRATDVLCRTHDGRVAPARGEFLLRFPEPRRRAHEIAKLRPPHVPSRGTADADDRLDRPLALRSARDHGVGSQKKPLGCCQAAGIANGRPFEKPVKPGIFVYLDRGRQRLVRRTGI